MVSWISPDYPFTIIMIKGASGNAKDLLEYILEAEPGTSSSAPYWRAKKLSYDSSGFNTNVQWADGDRNFTKIADNYASYTYS